MTKNGKIELESPTHLGVQSTLANSACSDWHSRYQLPGYLYLEIQRMLRAVPARTFPSNARKGDLHFISCFNSQSREDGGDCSALLYSNKL